MPLHFVSRHGSRLTCCPAQVGKFARVGTMLAKDSVKTRISSETGISYTEFTYQLLQGYDFVHLAQKHGCRAQVTRGQGLHGPQLGEGFHCGRRALLSWALSDSPGA